MVDQLVWGGGGGGGGCDKLREVGVFFYLDILCLKSHENGFGCGEAGNSQGFQFQRSGTDE